MTVRNSRLFLSLIAAAVIITGCGRQEAAISHRCQLLVILDKTNSVNFEKRRAYIQRELARHFSRTYAGATRDIESSLLVVTGNTKVFPEWCRFEKDKPEGDEDSREYQQRAQRWNMEKRIWLADRVRDVGARIDSPCRSNRTDIFSIFNGIGQVQKNGAPWDSVVVVIFSDMVHTCGPVNMVRDLKMDNARAKGKTVCSDLIRRGDISTVGNENLDLTIYTPDDMNNSGLVNQFWMGFFEQWGLKTNQYRFE